MGGSIYGNRTVLIDLEVDTDVLSVDAVNNRVGIGLTDPDSTLEVFSATTQQKWSYDADSFATITVANASHTIIATGESGDLTLDAGDDIILDSHVGKWRLMRNGTLTNLISATAVDGSKLVFDNQVSNAGYEFKCNDGGSGITALSIDAANAGAATFNDKVIATELDISGDCDIDGTTNLDNTDIDGTLVDDGSNISLDSTSTLNIDNSNTSNGITIGTATSGVPISIGHGTSETTINDNLTVTGDTTSSNGFIGFANGQDATLKVEITGSGTDGRDLTVEAGSDPTGATNQNGGDLLLKSGAGDGNGTSIMTFSTKTSAADATAERMRINTNGNVVINGSQTHAASLTIDGASASIALKEMANAPGDEGTFGQLWVKTASPNELYFTTDAGNDIQLTSGTSAAGGGGSVSNDDANLILAIQSFL